MPPEGALAAAGGTRGAGAVAAHGSGSYLSVPSRLVSMPLFRHILAPFDFSELSAQGVEFARRLAEVHGARLTILHVVQEPTFPSFYKLGALRIYGMVPDAEKLAWRALEKRFGEPDGERGVRYNVAKGEAESQIVHYAAREGCDLIVIASHGITGLEHVLLGSVAEKVVRQARCPVLIIKSFTREARSAGAERDVAGGERHEARRRR